MLKRLINNYWFEFEKRSRRIVENAAVNDKNVTLNTDHNKMDKLWNGVSETTRKESDKKNIPSTIKLSHVVDAPDQPLEKSQSEDVLNLAELWLGRIEKSFKSTPAVFVGETSARQVTNVDASTNANVKSSPTLTGSSSCMLVSETSVASKSQTTSSEETNGRFCRIENETCFATFDFYGVADVNQLAHAGNSTQDLRLPDDSKGSGQHVPLEETLSNEPPAQEKSVPDGGRGWVCVLGCFLSHMIFFGFAKSYGLLYVEIRYRFRSSATMTAWIGGLLNTLALIGSEYPSKHEALNQCCFNVEPAS